jgi:rSAM/selenodomain-associated transferase 1
MEADRNVACMMLKAPRPGLVKTRLAREVGEPEATRIYRSLVELQMSRLGAGWQIEIHHAPSDAEREMRSWLGNGHHYEPQADGDLGERMRAAMIGAFGRGACRVVFLGGDCPYVDGDVLRVALAALDAAEVVLGPATDGGYYLLGMKWPLPSLFEGIDWGTSVVLRQTMERITRDGLRATLLRELEDVDDLPSWERTSTLAGLERECGRSPLEPA